MFRAGSLLRLRSFTEAAILGLSQTSETWLLAKKVTWLYRQCITWISFAFASARLNSSSTQLVYTSQIRIQITLWLYLYFVWCRSLCYCGQWKASNTFKVLHWLASYSQSLVWWSTHWISFSTHNLRKRWRNSNYREFHIFSESVLLLLKEPTWLWRFTDRWKIKGLISICLWPWVSRLQPLSSSSPASWSTKLSLNIHNPRCS